MKFTILSHAGMLVEHNGLRLVTDPWLIGSCYWRSWWNFPEADPALFHDFKADFVYISHLHWDHYHGPSLRKFFTKQTRFLVPKACTTRMVDDLKTIGFDNIREIPHGETVTLGNDFTLCSYQFGQGVDSCAVIKGGGLTLLDANDCKVFGWPLQHLLRLTGKPDFVFRSHSSASPVPYCIDQYQKDFSDYRSQEDYAEEFARFAISVDAKYAIPFASNHCFLHKDTWHFNSTAVTPMDVQRYTNKLAECVQSRTRCVVMSPGSTWSDEGGFQLLDFDYDHRGEYIRGLAKKHAPKITAYYEEEEAEEANFPAFQEYFNGFLKSLPWFVRRRWKPFLFRIIDPKQTHRWLVEPQAKRVSVVDAEPADTPVIEVPPRVINDCSQLKMFSAWTPSKRLKIFLTNPGQIKSIDQLFLLLDAYELDNLPLTKNLRPRSLGNIFRRWREFAEAAGLVLKHKIFRRPFSIRHLYRIPQAGEGIRPEKSKVFEIGEVPQEIAGITHRNLAPKTVVSDDWTDVASVADIPAGTAKRFETAVGPVAVFHTDGQYFAIFDRCTHRNTPLSTGSVNQCEVTCPMHRARFSLKTGEALCKPATVAVQTFPVNVTGGRILVRLSAAAVLQST